MDKPYGKAAVLVWAMMAVNSAQAATEAHTLVIKSHGGGLVISSEDGANRFQLGGRLQWDLDLYKGAFNNDQNGATAHDTEIRRGRLELAGTLQHNFHYELALEVEPQSRWHLANLSYSGSPYARWTVGRFKEPFGLQTLTDSNDLTTIERSLIFDSINSGVADFGVQAQGYGRGWTWALGLFHPAQDQIVQSTGTPATYETTGGKDVYALTGRVTYAFVDPHNRLVHVGAAYSERNLLDYGNPNFNDQGLNSRLGVNHADVVSATPLDDTREDWQWGVEGLYQDGPLRFQGEFVQRSLEDNGGTTQELNGFYMQASYVLSGGLRRFDLRRGIPLPLTPTGAYGAWELAARWDRLQVQQSGSDGKIDAATLGMNWYANPYVKLMLNYSYASTDSLGLAESTGHALSGRMQLAF